MGRTLALIVLASVSVAIAKADEKPTPPPPNLRALAPENDWRLVKKANAQPQKIGVLSYYPNNGGGYTFTEMGDIVFYALPYTPTTYRTDYVEWKTDTKPNGERIRWGRRRPRTLSTISTSPMPFGGQTLYCPQMIDTHTNGVPRREDVSVGKVSRATSDGTFRLSITSDDHETRLKLKSIVPVLEHAEHAP